MTMEAASQPLRRQQWTRPARWRRVVQRRTVVVRRNCSYVEEGTFAFYNNGVRKWKKKSCRCSTRRR